MRKILLVYSDDDLRHSLHEQLSLQGDFWVTEAATLPVAREKIKSAYFDIILLDTDNVDLEREHDLEMRAFIDDLRDTDMLASVILITAQENGAEVASSLGLATDGFILKPFRLANLMARLHAHLYHAKKRDETIYKIGPYKFSPSAKQLVNLAKPATIQLTEKETNILRYLYHLAGKVATRDQLLAEVWGYNANVTTHTLETHIYRLRQKIAHNSDDGEILVTEQGGYRLIL